MNYDEKPREQAADRRRRNDVQHQGGLPEDRLTFLPNDILFSILSFLTIKQCVALSATCSDFRRRLPSLIPRLDTFRLDVGLRYCGHYTPKISTFPSRTLLRQFRIVLHNDYIDFPKCLKPMLVEAGVRDLIVEASNNRWFICNARQVCVFGIKSMRSLSLIRIPMMWWCYDRRPSSPFPCTNLTSLKIELCILHVGVLFSILASSPFLETLQLIRCGGLDRSTDKLSIHSASIKHLVLFSSSPFVNAIDIQAPKLEYLVVDVVTALRIEAPKFRNASFLLRLEPQDDLPDALMTLFGAAFPTRAAWIMLNSSTAPDILAAGNEIDEFIPPEGKEKALFFNLHFNLKDQSSTMLFTELLKKCNYCNTEFDIRVDSADSAYLQSANKPAMDGHLPHGLTQVELIKLQMKMPTKTFEGFLSNQNKITDELKQVGLQKLKSRTNSKLFEEILASKESLFEISSNIANCIEMKF
ncbi:uncharacterized protein LOC122044258 [Zingiber officinale]|uniref:uncharacterized protein LOC122044258 n=1 Tax=Zingiber officinale TaxID=94328 RepID=UPI001C4C4D52|nr:uncharacterized protein LOC122044258 [Zingiber officinale]